MSFLIYADIKKGLSTLQIIIETHTEKQIPINFKTIVDKDEINLIREIGGKYETSQHLTTLVFNGVNLKITEKDIYCILAPNSPISLRLNLSDYTNIDFDSFGIMDLNQGKSNLDQMTSIILNEDFVCNCMQCSAVLFQSTELDCFKLVQTDDISETFETSWCYCGCSKGMHHNTNSNNSLKQNFFNHVKPLANEYRTNVGYVTDNSLFYISKYTDILQYQNDVGKGTYFDLSEFESLENCFKLKKNFGHSLICSNCKTRVGWRSFNFLADYSFQTMNRFYLHSLSLIKCDGMVKSVALQLWPNILQELETSLFKELLQEHMLTGCSRFVFEKRSETNYLIPVLLLWLLEANTEIYLFSVPDLLGKYIIEPKKIMRIMYKECNSETNLKLGQTWLKDFSVHNVEASTQTIDLMLSLLKNNAYSLPKLLNMNQEFQISYLQQPQVLKNNR